MTDPGAITHSLASFANPAWFNGADVSACHVWVRGYRMMRVPASQLRDGTEVLDLGDVRAVFLRGSLNYLDTTSEVPRTGEPNVIHLGSLQARTAPIDTYLLLLTPHTMNGDETELATRERLSSAAGLLELELGQNVIYAHLFDNITKADGTGSSAYGRSVLVPTSLPVPDLPILKRLSAVSASLESLQEGTARRVKLSLRWANKSAGAGGIDEFLSRWIALEILAMPNTTDIRPANESLARAYGVSYEQAAVRFLLGRLFGLRSRIVHRGETPSIHSAVLDYLQAIHRDIFRELLGLACERHADSTLTANRAVNQTAL